MTTQAVENVSTSRGPQIHSEVLTALRDLKWAVFTRRVIIFSKKDEEPASRIEIGVHDSAHVEPTAHFLAAFLQDDGFVLQTSSETEVPSNEIWLTFPVNDGIARMSLPLFVLLNDDAAGWVRRSP
jgi:hypothetical protein